MTGNQITIPLNEYNRLTDTARRVDKLEETNGWLCGEVNKLTATLHELTDENDQLREIVSDLWDKAAYTMTRNNRESWRERLVDAGVEVDR